MKFGSHPVNLILRFLLELSALCSFGFWGWIHGSGLSKILLMLGIPLSMALVWGIFAVPADPSRSGNAPFPVNGLVRLTLEWAIFFLAFLALLDSDMRSWALVFLFLVAIHYTMSTDRIKWLLIQKKN